METTKKWYASKTMRFFSLVALGGGLNLLEKFVTDGLYQWQDFVLLGIALVGLSLRAVTDESISL